MAKVQPPIVKIGLPIGLDEASGACGLEDIAGVAGEGRALFCDWLGGVALSGGFTGTGADGGRGLMGLMAGGLAAGETGS